MYSVLIADDEVNIVEGLCKTIDWNGHGCTVIGTAYDGKEAVRLALENRPDIIVTDITMPKLSGLELIRTILDDGILASFIVLTCHEDFTFAREALRMGVCDYIVKETMTREEFYLSLEKAKQSLCRRRELASRTIAQEEPEVRQLLDYIREHMAERLTLEDVACFASMNSSYFSRYFKNKIGENFVDYLTRIRMEFAMEQLRLTSDPIHWIADCCGYSNLSYFHAAFKKATGVPPGTYRREAREKGKNN